MTDFSSKMDLLARKNNFPQKCLFLSKTYLNSFLHTKYEGLTRKTGRDSFKNQSGILSFSLLSFVSHSWTCLNEKWWKSWIFRSFFKLSRSVFRVRHSYLVFRELFKYVFGKNKLFGEILFFRAKRSIFWWKSDHFEGDFRLGISLDFDQISSKSWNPHLEMDLTRSSDGVGWSTAALFYLQYAQG